MGKLKKRALPEQAPVTVRPNGPLAGHELVMRRFNTRDYLAIKKGEVDDARLIEMTVAAVIDSTFSGDLLELDPLHVVAIANAWADAQKEAALPPVSGTV